MSSRLHVEDFSSYLVRNDIIYIAGLGVHA